MFNGERTPQATKAAAPKVSSPRNPARGDGAQSRADGDS